MGWPHLLWRPIVVSIVLSPATGGDTVCNVFGVVYDLCQLAQVTLRVLSGYCSPALTCTPVGGELLHASHMLGGRIPLQGGVALATFRSTVPKQVARLWGCTGLSLISSRSNRFRSSGARKLETYLHFRFFLRFPCVGLGRGRRVEVWGRRRADDRIPTQTTTTLQSGSRPVASGFRSSQHRRPGQPEVILWSGCESTWR